MAVTVDPIRQLQHELRHASTAAKRAEILERHLLVQIKENMELRKVTLPLRADLNSLALQCRAELDGILGRLNKLEGH